MGNHDDHVVTSVPLSAILLRAPPDGLPSIEDWLTTCVSFLFQGSRLHREPLDLYMLQPGKTPDDSAPYVGVKKGFTRLILGGGSA